MHECSDDERNERLFVDTAITLQALKDAAIMDADEKPHAKAECSKMR